jgi:hypothetical protein
MGWQKLFGPGFSRLWNLQDEKIEEIDGLVLKGKRFE